MATIALLLSLPGCSTAAAPAQSPPPVATEQGPSATVATTDGLAKSAGEGAATGGGPEAPPTDVASTTPTRRDAPAPSMGDGPAPGPPAFGEQRQALPTSPEQAVALIEEYERVLRRPDGGSTIGSGRSDRCPDICATVGLIRRAVDRLCQLTSSSDTRCATERSKLAELEKLGAEAGCRCTD